MVRCLLEKNLFGRAILSAGEEMVTELIGFCRGHVENKILKIRNKKYKQKNRKMKEILKIYNLSYFMTAL